MRWVHEGVDRLHVALASPLVPKLFRQSATSPSLHEHFAAVQLEPPRLTQTYVAVASAVSA